VEPHRVIEGYYSDLENPPVPVIPLKIFPPTRRKHIVVEAKLDTGFSGPLLLTPENYLSLGLHLYESTENVVGLIAGGYRVELRVSRGIVELGKTSVPVEIYTSVFVKKNIIGRQLLNEFKVVLDAKNGKVLLENP
jgi:clan AA aspartic protease